MDQQRLLEQFQAAATATAGRIAASASASRQDMAAMEQRIYDELDALKATFLQQWIDEAKDDSARPSCPHCGGRMRQKEQLPKTSSCIGGTVTVPRTRWWCSSCGESFFPSGRNDDGGRPHDHAPGRATGGAGGGAAAL